MRVQTIKLTLAAALLAIFTLMTGYSVFAGEEQVTFGVGCYDVGKAALDGRKGISKVTKGWKGFREINTVYYDPSEVSVKDMEKALKEAGTYKETMKEEN